MKVHPILMSAPMVRALLDGTKTQTRRLAWRFVGAGYPGDEDLIRKPTVWQKAKPGDLCYVRETWQDWCPIWDGYWCGCGSKKMIAETHRPAYRATPDERGEPKRWRPSIHMPRWASRLTLELTEVRTERLQDISEADARAEGVDPCQFNARDPLMAFPFLWRSLHDPDAWDANPEVMRLAFRVHQQNIDAFKGAA